MRYQYELEVGFHEDTANLSTDARYYQFLSIYDTTVIGHKKTETSTFIISSERELTRGELEEFLGNNIPILSLKKTE